MRYIRHFIIIKFENSVNIQTLIEPIRNLFNSTLSIEGIKKVEIYESNTNLPNRYDLMIEMLLTSQALKLFDNSQIHKTWKTEYGKYIVNKTIFDCDY